MTRAITRTLTCASLRVLAALVARLPQTALPWLGGALGWLVGSLLRVRRALVEAAMRRAKLDEPRRTAAAMYRELGFGVFELLWLAGASSKARARALARVAIDHEAVTALDEAAERGSVMLFASHTGNWELAAAAAGQLLARRGKRLVVVAKAMRVGGLDAFVTRLRARLGFCLIAPNGALSGARRALEAGDVVVMPIDQVPDRAAHGMRVRFLHGDALADRAPATLAWRTKATILVVAAQRLADGCHRVVLLETIIPPPSRTHSSAIEWVESTTARATASLEAFVRRSPESWLWLHRRWKMPLSPQT